MNLHYIPGTKYHCDLTKKDLPLHKNDKSKPGEDLPQILQINADLK